MIYDIIRKTFDFEHAYKDEKKEIIWVSKNMVSTYILCISIIRQLYKHVLYITTTEIVNKNDVYKIIKKKSAHIST